MPVGSFPPTIIEYTSQLILRSQVGLVAQLVEQCPFKALVRGSSPRQPTIFRYQKWLTGRVEFPLPASFPGETGSFFSSDHFHKYCSHAVIKGWGSGLFGFGLRFGSVTGRYRHAPSPKPRPNPKILAPRDYSISSNALDYFHFCFFAD